ncbi:hypothetical protein AN958_11672, partial [Leucoagaricus sp. SymC.cos]
QSKLYPTAFGTDESILLCALTAAGKVFINYQDESDPGLIQKRVDIIHSAAVLEKIELSGLLEGVPIPIKESVEEPAAKINVFLQAYISQLKLGWFVLVVGMVFVQQSAGRIQQAMFEICLKRGWAIPTTAALDLCKMVKRMWRSMTPLRQFNGVLAEIIREAEGKQFNAGKLVHRLVHDFPELRWDVLSRRWRQRKNVQNIGLLIADEIQQVEREVRPTYEVVNLQTRDTAWSLPITSHMVIMGVQSNEGKGLLMWLRVCVIGYLDVDVFLSTHDAECHHQRPD